MFPGSHVQGLKMTLAYRNVVTEQKSVGKGVENHVEKKLSDQRGKKKPE